MEAIIGTAHYTGQHLVGPRWTLTIAFTRCLAHTLIASIAIVAKRKHNSTRSGSVSMTVKTIRYTAR